MSDTSLPAMRGAAVAKPTKSDAISSFERRYHKALATTYSELTRDPGDDALIKAVQAEAERLLAPAGPKEAAAAIELVAATLQVDTPSDLGLKPYLRILGALPKDLLVRATERILETHTFKTLPTPAEWLQHAQEEWERRKGIKHMVRIFQMRLAYAEKFYPKPPPPRSDAERQRMLDQMAEHTALKTVKKPGEVARFRIDDLPERSQPDDA